ncbi:MAG TPA: LptF/LptG family permease [Candidatus Hydrogenedentes bacterium]|nr:LptF/LptG family permease [Candidatus Hydrogenedentota bacterium]HOL77619.1 LptF/LptG family permease [Candidatus Hydrogenedentota bacterium]HPO86744.1 LptF/LptG family permease [Candidatus Hydrogenedentota bacterium]
MRQITRYILRETATPSLLALGVFSFLGVVNELRERIREFDVAHVFVSDFTKLALWFLPTLLYYIVPITYMMGVLLAFGRFAQQNEITAMQAAGIPLKRVVMPVLVCGLFLSGACFVLQDRLQPAALRKINDLIYTQLPLRLTMDAISPGVVHEIGNWRVYIGGRDRKTDTLENVDILVTQDNGEIWLYHADKAQFVREGARLQLYIPECFLILPGNPVHTRITDLTLSPPAPQARKRAPERRMLSLRELLERDAALQKKILESGRLSDMRSLYGVPSSFPEGVSIRDWNELRSIRAETRERISLPFACLAVSLVAAPLAARARSGGRSYGFAVGFAIILGYYLLLMLTQARGLPSLGEAILRGAVPNLVLAGIGLWAMWRVDRI